MADCCICLQACSGALARKRSVDCSSASEDVVHPSHIVDDGVVQKSVPTFDLPCCGNTVHTVCLRRWERSLMDKKEMQLSCPLCRSEIPHVVSTQEKMQRVQHWRSLVQWEASMLHARQEELILSLRRLRPSHIRVRRHVINESLTVVTASIVGLDEMGDEMGDEPTA
tara:strand:+ start:102 stop:605 length:504 start_codon:yes stop_codon:yes gene_type:complete